MKIAKEGVDPEVGIEEVLGGVKVGAVVLIIVTGKVGPELERTSGRRKVKRFFKNST